MKTTQSNRQLVFDYLRFMVHDYADTQQISAATGLSVKCVQEQLRRLYYAGLVYRNEVYHRYMAVRDMGIEAV